MKTLPALVDDNADINLHGRQGAVISIKFTNDDGTARDVSSRVLTFECCLGAISINLSNGATSDERLLTISQTQVKQIYQASDRRFVLLDNSASVPTPVWEGQIYVHGWSV